jgi:hypothetical protein
MKRTFMMLLLMAMASTSTPIHAEPKPYGKQTEQSNPSPPYAKWGMFAIRGTNKKHPNAKIVDYLHVGRQTVSSITARETFKLWLKQGNREFGIYVRIHLIQQPKRFKQSFWKKQNDKSTLATSSDDGVVFYSKLYNRWLLFPNKRNPLRKSGLIELLPC